MMKLNPINWNVPGTKCCVHENGMTAVVSETDSVYLYSGGRREPLQMLAFNPKSGQAVYMDGKFGGQLSIDNLGKFSETKEAKQVYEKGFQLLVAAHYLPLQPESENGKIYEWLQSLRERPPIERKELKIGHLLVASLLRSPEEYERLHVYCRVLGDCRVDGANLSFQVEKDPDLNYGIGVWEEKNHNTKLFFAEQPHNGFIGCSNEVELTREEAKWLRELLPPYPAQRFLNVHVEMMEAVEAKRQERARGIRRSVSHAGGKTDPFGTVAI